MIRVPHGRTLRFRLFMLAASGLVPLALVAVVVIGSLIRDRTLEAQSAALDVSRALATAVDAELRSIGSILQSLAQTGHLASGRLDDFRPVAARVAEGQGWRSLLVADGTGRILMNSAQPSGTPDPQPVDVESMRRAIETRMVTVGRVAEGRQKQGPAFAVRLPVIRDGQLIYVVSAVIPAERILAVVARQRVPEGWVVAIFDQAGNRVARSREHAVARPSPTLQALLDRGGSEGAGPTTTLEGVPSQTGFTRLQASGWVVAIGISQREADRGFYAVLAAVAGGLAASLALSAFLAWYFTRQVTEPIDQLKAAAGALGRGEEVRLPPLGISELQDVAAALAHAADDRDRAAREREDLLARVTDALRLAEEAARSKDEFLAMLGHELRNPLAPIATALHLMARKGDASTRIEREVVERQLGHMTRLVDDLLDVSRITSKRLAMRFEPVRLADLVEHAAQGIPALLGDRLFRVHVDDDARGLWVSGDQDRLGQVLNNLLGNAIKFTPAEAPIELALRSGGEGFAEIVLTDGGVGMPPEVREHVFDLFYQAPQGADRSRGGLGLGLAIVRSLVEMHGGSVRAESEGTGHGSRFIVRLPTMAAPPAPEPARESPHATGMGRVLVVDDNQDAADTAAALLEIAGYEVKVAYHPQEALALLESFHPQVAVLDIGLPGMSGYELAGQVRAHPGGAQCYLVALTGYGTQADAARATAAGFAAHLVKPAGPDALLEAVARGLAPAPPAGG
ncbi:response regulator [Caenimonas sedimenti]|uniref:histidine kinase n=1 Tax=Caenimonas sedimenti TaxID=2596921 RepID=A0A562ZTI5_9BURK|nr:ATP-binding protein [Caenimonas sedimenti]TWO71595.1 response regulator [Caenimonas sedimenti]